MATAVAAVNTGRRCLGLEIDPAYVALAGDRVSAALADSGATGTSSAAPPRKRASRSRTAAPTKAAESSADYRGR